MKAPKLKKKKPSLNRVYSSQKKLGIGKEARLEVRSLKLEEKKPYFQISSPNQLPNPSTLNQLLFFFFVLLLPTQLGKHFFFAFSYLSGVRVDYLAPTIYVTDILAFLLFITNIKLIWTILKQKKVLVLLSILFLNSLLSQLLTISIYRFLKIVELIGIFFIFRRTRLSSRLLLSGFLIGGAFELSLTVAQFIGKHSLQGLFYFFGERPLSLSLPGIAKASLSGVEILRPYGTFSHPNSLAGFYLLVYFFVLTRTRLISTNFNKFQLISTALLLVCSLLIFLSFSKVAIVTFIILNFVYLLRSPLKKSCRLCLFSRLFIISIVSLVFLQAKADPLTLEKRLHLSQNALSIISKHLISGVGLGSYLLAQQQFRVRFTDVLNQPVHNIILLLISEIGVVFTVIVVALFLKEIKVLFKKYPYIFLAVLITGLFDHYWLTLQQNFLLIGVMIGLLLNSNNQLPRNKQYSNNK